MKSDGDATLNLLCLYCLFQKKIKSAAWEITHAQEIHVSKHARTNVGFSPSQQHNLAGVLVPLKPVDQRDQKSELCHKDPAVLQIERKILMLLNFC